MMKIRETIKDFFALTSATGLGGATRLAARTLLATLLLAMTATTAWADNVTLSEDSQIAAGTAGHWYVNMPSGSGTNMLTLSDATVTTFKVYDDGGASGNYSDNCSGTLTLTAPEGYVLQLSGSMTTESFDKLTVYDGSDNTATKLLDEVSSTRDGEETAITTVRSSGQSMTLYFYSDVAYNYAGLDLTVTLINPNAQHSITINTATGGNVAATVGGTSASTAKENDVVTLTATPESCYVLSGLSVTDGSGNAVAVTWDGPFYNTATFTMPYSAVTVTPTFTNTLTVDGGLYINMPATGTKSATIPAGVQSFKVYDDGGASGNYSNKCSGTLTLTAPVGYMLQLSGSMTTETYDKLTVYDGSDDTATRLLNEVSSTRDGEETAITTVQSSGQSMTLYFHSDVSDNYAGLDLTVTLINPNAQHSITINTATGGNVAATVGGTSASTAKENDVVTLTATPESCYVLSGLSVTDGSGNAVAVTWDGPFYNTATFTMPYSAVTVTPTFTNTLTVDGGLYINMPATGTKSATIPAGVQSFKVYDDGGAGGNYSDNCSGTLTLTASEGYVLQLSGSMTTESFDRLTVYDGSDNTATKLLDEVRSTSSGTLTDITTVTSSGQSMTLYFHSDGSKNYDGLDLTVTLTTRNSITVNTATGGNVAATVGGTSASFAMENDVVTLTATPESGYLLSGLSVMDGSGNAVAVTWSGMFSNTATFTMPCSAVTVTPTFTNTWTAADGLFISMPTTGTNSFNIPAGVQSFKVYDDGGAGGTGKSYDTTTGGNYSNNCSGTLTLTAPTGYAFRLSGSINTESSDKLTVYDGSDNTATKLLDEVHSLYGGKLTDITTVTSSGQSMTLYFHSDRTNNYPGLDLTVTLVVTYTVSFNANGGTGDAMATQTFTYDAALALSPNAYERTGYSFAGWATTADGEVVYADGEIVSNLASTPDAKVELFAKWTKNELALLNDDSEAAEKNSGIISGAAGDGKVYDVTLTGRTLYKDGKWNTLCLPFALSAEQIAAHTDFSGATLMELNTDGTNGFDTTDGTLYLTFKSATAIAAGVPYLVKWDAAGTDFTSPTFSGVTISAPASTTVSDADDELQEVQMVGCYSPVPVVANDKSILFLGDANTLYYSTIDRDIRSCRAYFSVPYIKEHAGASEARAFRLDFGEGEQTGIMTVQGEGFTVNGSDAWYTLDGRKLDGKPATKGLYINGGKKVVIK